MEHCKKLIVVRGGKSQKRIEGGALGGRQRAEAVLPTRAKQRYGDSRCFGCWGLGREQLIPNVVTFSETVEYRPTAIRSFRIRVARL